MKKILLFLSVCSAATAAHAQYRECGLMQAPQDQQEFNATSTPKHYKGAAAYKTTAGGDRWYSYADYMDTLFEALGAGDIVAGSYPYLWNDSMSIHAYSGATPWAHNRTISYGTIFHPFFNKPSTLFLPADSGFNNYSLYPGAMRLTASDAYVVDTIVLYGRYGINPAKAGTGLVDTLKLTFLKGNGGSAATTDIYSGYTVSGTNYGLGSAPLAFMDMDYDSIANRASGTTARNVNLLIRESNWGDTTNNGVFVQKVAVNPPMSMSAGELFGMSVSFKSGDASFPTGGDTVFRGSASAPNYYKYNMFRPLVYYRATGSATSPTPLFPIYSENDENEGLYKTAPTFANGWSGTYVCMWAYYGASPTTPSSTQYPAIDIHVNCSGCGTITPPNSVSGTQKTIKSAAAYPNPASGMVTVNVALQASGDATVSITNMLGQEVASQKLSHTSVGKAIFHTSHLPAGVYQYTVTANGERVVGALSIVH